MVKSDKANKFMSPSCLCSNFSSAIVNFLQKTNFPSRFCVLYLEEVWPEQKARPSRRKTTLKIFL